MLAQTWRSHCSGQCRLDHCYAFGMTNMLVCETGTLPDTFANMSGLLNMDLHDNYLTGQLPAAWFTPSAFTNYTFIEV